MKFDPAIKEYKSVSNRIGLCLILFVVFFNVTATISSLISSVLESLLRHDIAYSIGQVLSMASYLLSFMIPAVIIRAVLKPLGNLQPIRLEVKLPKSSLLLIPAAIAVSFCTAYINSRLLDIFNISDAYSELVGGYVGGYSAYEIVLLFISTAIVPAVCEEFLFRGVVLSNLLPFGRGIAIVGSSVLFGLMHQNPYQILYTTAAGMVIGYAYVKTESIWCPMLIHFCNNAFSIIEQVMAANYDVRTANVVISVMELCAVVIGLTSFAVYLVIDLGKKRDKYKNGSFGVILETDDAYEERDIPAALRLRGFFSGGMIAFIAVTFISIAATIVMLMIISGIGAA